MWLCLLAALLAAAPLAFAPASWAAWDGSTAGAYESGAGTDGDPYVIKTGAQLAYLAQQVNAGTDYDGVFFKLGDDIDLDNREWAPIGGKMLFQNVGTENPKTFKGTFDGNDKTIENISISGIDGSFVFVGLFGHITGATIKDLVLEGVSINVGASDVGGLAGRSGSDTSTNSIISNVTVSGTVTGGTLTGGLVGTNHDAAIDKCVSAAAVSGSLDVGGLVGQNNGTVGNSMATGTVTATWVAGGSFAGGLVGKNTDTVSASYAGGTVNVPTDSTHAIYGGGLVGLNAYDQYLYDGKISDSFSDAAVSVGSGNYGGGLVGSNQSDIERCFASGTVTVAGGGTGGGLVGSAEYRATECLAAARVTGSGTRGGLYGAGTYNFAADNSAFDLGVSTCQQDASSHGRYTLALAGSAATWLTTNWTKQQGSYPTPSALLNASILNGISAAAASAFAVTAAAPAVPTNVTATAAGSGQATVSFTAPANHGSSVITGYTVTYTPGNITATGTASPITVTGLTNGTAYTFSVQARNIVGLGTASAISNTVTPVTNAVPPGAPTNITVSAGNGQATVSFTPPANAGSSAITGYRVTSSPGGFTASGTASPITVTGLTNGTAYTFSVQALNGQGTGTASAASNTATPVANPATPGAPTGVTAVAGNGQATVSFTAPANPGNSAITSYIVTSSPGNFTGTGTASPITVTGLANGTAYTFSVKALNAQGTGTASAASAAVTPSANAAAFTVTFNSQGGSAVTSLSNVPSGGKITRPASPVRSGYVFGGWYREAACVTAWDFGSDTVTANTTLYAKWSAASSTGPNIPSLPGNPVNPGSPDDMDDILANSSIYPYSAMFGSVSLGTRVTGTYTFESDVTVKGVIAILTLPSGSQAEVPVSWTAGSQTATFTYTFDTRGTYLGDIYATYTRSSNPGEERVAWMGLVYDVGGSGSSNWSESDGIGRGGCDAGSGSLLLALAGLALILRKKS
jgi:uncharacterized repeat protein (TIGR02543 family)